MNFAIAKFGAGVSFEEHRLQNFYMIRCDKPVNEKSNRPRHHYHLPLDIYRFVFLIKFLSSNFNDERVFIHAGKYLKN